MSGVPSHNLSPGPYTGDATALTYALAHVQTPTPASSGSLGLDPPNIATTLSRCPLHVVHQPRSCFGHLVQADSLRSTVSNGATGMRANGREFSSASDGRM